MTAGTRNLVAEETADLNRRGAGLREDGGFTFNAPLAADYTGPAFTVAAVRLGDHAHVVVESGQAVASPEGRFGRIRVQPYLRVAKAGKLILRWHEWIILRDFLASDERFHVVEVERPTQGMIERYAS